MKIKHIALTILASIGLTACGDMDFHEYKVDDEDYIKETFGSVYGFMTYIYRDLDYDFGQMYSGASLCSATDEAVYSHQGNSIETYYNGSWSPVNTNSSVWNTCWDGIAYCNLVLDKFNNLKFEDYMLDKNYQAEMEKYNNFQWECRFMRAYFYFQLVRQYGSVPLKVKDMDADAANNLPCVPADTIFKFIDEECVAIKDTIVKDYAQAYPALGLTENGRANNLAVLALRARAALYHASPLFTQGKSDAEVKALWKAAAEACNNAITECKSRGMALASDYSQLFLSTNWSNADALKELIFARRNAASNAFEKYNFPIGMENAGGGNCPTENLVSAYETTNGKTIAEDPAYDPQNPYANRDSRLAKTVAVNGERFPQSLPTATLEIYYGGSNSRSVTYGTPTGYYLKKYVNPTTVIGASNATNLYHNWVIFRLGELYLDYAEAMLNYTGSGYATEGNLSMSAAQAINIVRTRAGLPNIATGLSYDAFWERYQNERFVELAFEGHRYYDVRRWMKGETYFKNIKVCEITKGANDVLTFRTVTNPSYITPRQWDNSKYNFSPIPQSEILKSGALTQTPGW